MSTTNSQQESENIIKKNQDNQLLTMINNIIKTTEDNITSNLDQNTPILETKINDLIQYMFIDKTSKEKKEALGLINLCVTYLLLILVSQTYIEENILSNITLLIYTIALISQGIYTFMEAQGFTNETKDFFKQTAINSIIIVCLILIVTQIINLIKDLGIIFLLLVSEYLINNQYKSNENEKIKKVTNLLINLIITIRVMILLLRNSKQVIILALLLVIVTIMKAINNIKEKENQTNEEQQETTHGEEQPETTEE